MTRMALGLSYNGSAYHGWQTQPTDGTIQDTLQAAITQFTTIPTTVVCAGRTDAGVHALEQVVHFETTAERSLESWSRGLNALLPLDIRIIWAQPVRAEFHARFSAKSRTYIYLLRNHRINSAIWQRRAGWDFHPLDISAMRTAAEYLLGEHDFSSFRSSQCQATSPVRTLELLNIQECGHLIIFTLKANAFLHHMVRNILGCLLYVGKGKHDPSWLQQVLLQKNRRYAAPTFMPDGLYLAHIEYPEYFDLPPLHNGFDVNNPLAAILNA